VVMNAEHVGRRWEKGTPPPSSRFTSAAKMQEVGWPIRFRSINDSVPRGGRELAGWLREAWSDINNLSPEMSQLEHYEPVRGPGNGGREQWSATDLFKYLSEKDPSGFKYRLPFEQQVEMYRFVIDARPQEIIPALCKEDVSVWKAVGLKFDGCHCLHSGSIVQKEIVSTAELSSGAEEKVNLWSSTVIRRPEKSHDALPKMVPHTAAKHLLLKRYLDRWFPILGKYHQRINYFDGFAGPGEYEDVSQVLLFLRSKQRDITSSTERFHRMWISISALSRPPRLCSAFAGQAEALTHPPQFKVGVVEGEFANVMAGCWIAFRKKTKSWHQLSRSFDPFGFSGIPFDLMARILAYPRCEVFINIMIDFINRFLEHPNDKVLAHFPSTFGTDEVLSIQIRVGTE